MKVYGIQVIWLALILYGVSGLLDNPIFSGCIKIFTGGMLFGFFLLEHRLPAAKGQEDGE